MKFIRKKSYEKLVLEIFIKVFDCKIKKNETREFAIKKKFKGKKCLLSEKQFYVAASLKSLKSF